MCESVNKIALKLSHSSPLMYIVNINLILNNIVKEEHFLSPQEGKKRAFSLKQLFTKQD